MYELMLERVRGRMGDIEQVSLEDDSFNKEWLELSAMEDSLIKLIKLIKER